MLLFRMAAALQGLWRESCVLDPVTLGRTIADVAHSHFCVYVIYCSNGIYQNRKLNELMSVHSARSPVTLLCIACYTRSNTNLAQHKVALSIETSMLLLSHNAGN